jgi:small-conductance mechanosensitive channel
LKRDAIESKRNANDALLLTAEPNLNTALTNALQPRLKRQSLAELVSQDRAKPNPTRNQTRAPPRTHLTRAQLRAPSLPRIGNRSQSIAPFEVTTNPSRAKEIPRIRNHLFANRMNATDHQMDMRVMSIVMLERDKRTARQAHAV